MGVVEPIPRICGVGRATQEQLLFSPTYSSSSSACQPKRTISQGLKEILMIAAMFLMELQYLIPEISFKVIRFCLGYYERSNKKTRAIIPKTYLEAHGTLQLLLTTAFTSLHRISLSGFIEVTPGISRLVSLAISSSQVP